MLSGYSEKTAIKVYKHGLYSKILEMLPLVRIIMLKTMQIISNELASIHKESFMISSLWKISLALKLLIWLCCLH